MVWLGRKTFYRRDLNSGFVQYHCCKRNVRSLNGTILRVMLLSIKRKCIMLSVTTNGWSLKKLVWITDKRRPFKYWTKGPKTVHSNTRQNWFGFQMVPVFGSRLHQAAAKCYRVSLINGSRQWVAAMPWTWLWHLSMDLSPKNEIKWNKMIGSLNPTEQEVIFIRTVI